MKNSTLCFLFFLTLLSCCSQHVANDEMINKGYFALLGEDTYGEVFIVQLEDGRILFTQHNDVVGWDAGHIIDTITTDSIIFDSATFRTTKGINLRIVSWTRSKLILEFGDDNVTLFPFIRNLSGEQFFEFTKNKYDDKYEDRRDSILRSHSLLRSTRDR